MTPIIITTIICVTVIVLFVLYLRAVSGNVEDSIVMLQAGHEAHSTRLEQLEREVKKHGGELTKSALGKLR